MWGERGGRRKGKKGIERGGMEMERGDGERREEREREEGGRSTLEDNWRMVSQALKKTLKKTLRSYHKSVSQNILF